MRVFHTLNIVYNLNPRAEAGRWRNNTKGEKSAQKGGFRKLHAVEMYITGRQTGEYTKECIQKVRRCVTIRSDALFDPDGMKKEKKESAVLDPLDGWGTWSAATTWRTGSSNRRTSDPVLYDRPLYGTRRDMYRKPSEMVLV